MMAPKSTMNYSYQMGGTVCHDKYRAPRIAPAALLMRLYEGNSTVIYRGPILEARGNFSSDYSKYGANGLKFISALSPVSPGLAQFLQGRVFIFQRLYFGAFPAYSKTDHSSRSIFVCNLRRIESSFLDSIFWVKRPFLRPVQLLASWPTLKVNTVIIQFTTSKAIDGLAHRPPPNLTIYGELIKDVTDIC